MTTIARHTFLAFPLLLLIATTSYAQSEWKLLMRQGNSAARQERFADAEVFFRKAMDADSSSARLRYNLGNALLSQRKPKDAMMQYEKAAKVETNPLFKAAMHHNMGVIFQSQKQFAEAIECYKEALRNNPTDDRTRYNLALCQHQLKNQPPEGEQNQNQQEQEQNQQQQKDKQQQEQQQKDEQSQQQDKSQMSKENADQMLQAAMMQENKTQEKVQKAQQQPRRRNVEKNW